MTRLNPLQETALAMRLERQAKAKKQITDLDMENMDKKRELIKGMVQVAIKMQKELSFTNPNTATDEDAFALMLTNYFGYDGSSIKEVTCSALEDSNFHSFNEKFENLWNKEMGGK